MALRSRAQNPSLAQNLKLATKVFLSRNTALVSGKSLLLLRVELAKDFKSETLLVNKKINFQLILIFPYTEPNAVRNWCPGDSDLTRCAVHELPADLRMHKTLAAFLLSLLFILV